MTTVDNNVFGTWLKKTRKTQGFTQGGLAEKVGCAFETIRKIEAGTRRPSPQVAELIGRVLKVPEHEMPELIEKARRSNNGSEDEPIVPINPVKELLDSVGASGDLDLPWPLNTVFVGREQEVAEICAKLMQSDVRLLTMVGAGGIGKTRLAVQVASRCRTAFKHGAFVVLLAAASGPDMFMSSLMLGLGLQTAAGPGPAMDPKQSVYNFLRERHALILLDNMEHMLACAPQVADLLKNCPQIKILVTSREPLHLAGEKQYHVPPLSNAPGMVPIEAGTDDRGENFDENSPANTSDAASYYSKYEAVQLFVSRAGDVDPNFRLTDDNAYYVAQICLELDGLPLAIEIAASQSKMLTPKALLKRLSKQLRLGMRGADDLPDRQRTLRGTIDWSYSLLSDDERKLFRRLGVFSVGRSLDAIEAICVLPDEQDEENGMDVYQVTASLLDKSLIGRETDREGESRYFMLRVTKEYALWQLKENNETELLRKRHANYYMMRAESAELELTGARRDKWLNRLDDEIYNMRAAMEWALTPDPDYAPGSKEANKKAEIALRIAGALNWYWYLRGRILEGREWLEKALAATQPVKGAEISIKARARALDTLGRLLMVHGAMDGVIEMLAESVRLWRQTSDKRGLAYALANRGAALAYKNREKDETGVPSVEEALSLFKQIDDKWGIAYTLDVMGDAVTLVGKGDDEAYRFKQQSLILYKDLEDKWGISSLLTELGYNMVRRGEYNTARKLLEEAVEMSKKVGDKRYIAFATAALAEVVWYMGNPISARNLYSESLKLNRELGDRRGESNSLRNLGHLAHREGDERQASSLYFQSLRIEDDLASEPNKALLLIAFAGLVGALGKTKQAARLLASADNALKLSGGMLPPIDRIQRKYTYETLRSLLGDADFDAEMTFGKSTPLEKSYQMLSLDLPQFFS